MKMGPLKDPLQSTTMIPVISVVMPVYNAAAYLSAAVDSILAQTFTDFELIAIDDGSTDASLEILQQMAERDSRIRIISRPNTGIVGALNDGVARAQGEFVARMDADDVALPHRFERQLGFLRETPGCVAVGSALLLMDSDGDPIGVQQWATTHEEIDRLLLTGWSGLAHPTAMIRKAALQQVGGYRSEYEWVEDKDLWLRLAEIGQLANLSEPLLRYRVHETSLSCQRESDTLRLWETLLKETYQRRGLMTAPPNRSRRRRKASSANSARANWIRAAARSGNYRTAAKHARKLVREFPFQPSTWLTLLRAATYPIRRSA
jgi:glycosyltransferase involved in cell wall biosynthesis